MNSSKSNCTGWTAIHDFMPPGPGVLRVTGECEFPTPGFTVTLKKKVPQGPNPTILILEKLVVRPSKPEPDVIPTLVEAKYSETTGERYKQVQIEPDGATCDVKKVH